VWIASGCLLFGPGLPAEQLRDDAVEPKIVPHEEPLVGLGDRLPSDRARSIEGDVVGVGMASAVVIVESCIASYVALL
jgi:hypothetical protein